MTKNSPDERLVYLALRGILQGENAGLRKLKKVKKIVEKYQNQADIKNLAREFKLESICQVAVDLLKDRVFESTLRAKARFPEVFEVSPTQTAKRAISESEAAKHEDAAISSVVQGQQQQQQAPGHKPTLSSVERNETDRQCKCYCSIMSLLLLIWWSSSIPTDTATPGEDTRTIILSCLLAIQYSTSTPR